MKKGIITGVCIAAAVLLAGLSFSRSQKSEEPTEPIHRSSFLLDTFVDITIYDSDDTELLDQAIEICADYENLLSRTLETSEIYKLNHRSPEQQTFTLSDQTAFLLEKALSFSELSDGAFDVTTEPLSSLWNFSGSGEHKIPDDALIKEAVAKTGYQNLKLDGNTLTFLSPDTTIDLGAIAKGFIADEIKDYLVEKKVKSAIINLGGNVLCVGKKPDGSPFRVGLKKPFSETSESFGIVASDGMSVVTSGVYERHFIIDGKNYHHILNPRTGYPYDNGLISVSILSEKSVDGDGLSTTCFSLGLDRGMELINSLDGVYACFIDEDYNVYYSDGMEDFMLEKP